MSWGISVNMSMRKDYFRYKCFQLWWNEFVSQIRAVFVYKYLNKQTNEHTVRSGHQIIITVVYCSFSKRKPSSNTSYVYVMGGDSPPTPSLLKARDVLHLSILTTQPITPRILPSVPHGVAHQLHGKVSKIYPSASHVRENAGSMKKTPNPGKDICNWPAVFVMIEVFIFSKSRF